MSHEQHDEVMTERAKRLADVLARRPELIALAREEVVQRLQAAGPSERRTLYEWLQVLDSMSPIRLRRWLTDGGEQATRLRQAMPITFVRAAATPDR